MPHAEDHRVKATLNYYLDPVKGGYESFWFGTVGEKRRPFECVEVPITDIRGKGDEFKLDVHGFEYVKERSGLAPEDTENHEKIKQVYYGECEKLLKRITGGSRVHIMGHVCRKSNWDKFAEVTKNRGDMDRTPIPTSARYIHVDYSYAGAETRLHFYLPHEAHNILSHKTRWAIINIWRPIHPVTRENLTFLDASSIPDTSLRPVVAKFRRPENHEQLSEVTRKALERNDVETWSVARPEKEEGEHRWYYCKNMMPEEAIVFKIFDSCEREGVARRVPHTAFQCEEDFGEDRQSVELRGLVLWDE
ncbi:hypothetical protein CBER1_09720 [Cercospora berteroae]|uniref:Uncharacterized protein n=1 Tax=Cercospora berteroae TaxID=357750 RepID=A0A2S6CDY8_9PEZI|nr:hypothetical protein CBER1_09720 [Cercospora berteroae]